MLTNRDLEGGFAPYDGIGELKMAEGWIPWYIERLGVHRPEYKPHTEDAYVHTGGYSQKMFTTFAQHHAGMLQKVQAVDGKWYRFSAWARSRVTDNKPWSYLLAVGANPYGADPLEDIGSLFNHLGPASWTIDEWVRLSVTFQAWAPTITVFTFGKARDGLHWMDSYWDSFDLVPVADIVPEPEPDPDPDPDPIPGCQFNEELFEAAVDGLMDKIDSLSADVRAAISQELRGREFSGRIE